MRRPFFSREMLLGDRAILAYLAALKLALHFSTNGNYGYFRDELYYMACGEHLDWGYVDQPPLIAVIARATRLLLGDSLFALRLLPALAGAALVYLTGLIVRELGGGRYAVVLAAVSVIVLPIYLYMHTVLTMNAFEPLIWMLCAYLAIRIFKGASEKLWLLFGAIAGLGLLNKHSMMFFGVSFVLGLALTPYRKYFLSRWLWLGGLIAFVIFLPNLIWEAKHDWATLEVLRNADKNQNLQISPLSFLLGQILIAHPLAFPLWLAGLHFYLFSPAAKQFRTLGWTFITLFVLLVALKGKIYYLAPAYPMLLAAGAVAFERFIARRNWRWMKPATLIALTITGALIAPSVLPILPVETYLGYARILPIAQGARTEKNAWGKMPQHFADMFGWEEMVATVARAYDTLTPEEKTKCAIFGDNYGEAGAVDFFGAKYGLPKAISGHQNYFLWGPRDYTGEVFITMSSDLEDLQPLFESVEPAGVFRNQFVMPYENNATIYICRRMKVPLKQFWPKVKCFSC